MSIYIILGVIGNYIIKYRFVGGYIDNKENLF